VARHPSLVFLASGVAATPAGERRLVLRCVSATRTYRLRKHQLFWWRGLPARAKTTRLRSSGPTDIGNGPEPECSASIVRDLKNLSISIFSGSLHDKMPAMYPRLATVPDHSFFLFGPRATGKTTWLRHHLPDALWFNLLLDADYLPLLGSAATFRERVEAQPRGSWVVVDEVQRLPGLLNEVHDLISRYGDDYKFALSGSSARKLRRLDVNLLAGRVIDRAMLPLVCAELGADFDLESALRFGTLPGICTDERYRVEKLRAYVHTYLRQEIQQEALVKDLGSFHRFLKVAALMHGQVVNQATISRDAAVARTTVQRYFDTLVDTLVGFMVPAWRPKAKVREAGKPKFFFFDPGVVRAIRDVVDEPLADADCGTLLEGLILHELRAATAYRNLGGEISYWSTPGSKEIDFIWSKGSTRVAVEVKNSRQWRSRYAKTINEFLDAGLITRGFVVYRGKDLYRSGAVDGLPVEDFLSLLQAGSILASR
jgi:predicted AAA+ superfamily ATPase